MNFDIRKCESRSSLTIWRCRCCGSGLIPGPWTSTCPKKKERGVPIVAQRVTNLTSTHEDAGLRIAMSCGVGRRRGLDPTLLWLWCRPAAVALIRPLAWELPYAAGAALKRKKKKVKFTLLRQHKCYSSLCHIEHKLFFFHNLLTSLWLVFPSFYLFICLVFLVLFIYLLSSTMNSSQILPQ